MTTSRPAKPMRERARTSLEQRLSRLRPALWPLGQTAVAAGVSWGLAQAILDHKQPIFASITAIVAMGFAAGRRGRQVVLIVVGTALGIGLADLLVSVLGSGWLQVSIVVFLAMLIGLLLSPDPLFVSQVAISAMLLVAVERQSGLSGDRLGDAVVGGLVAIVFSVVLFPVDPLRLVRTRGTDVFDELASTLDDAAHALRTGNVVHAARARARVIDDLALLDAVELALDVTRIAPLRRRHAARVRGIAAATAELPALTRGVRVVAGSTLRLVREQRDPRPELADPLDELADAVRDLWEWLDTDDLTARDRARERVETTARRAATLGGGASLAEGALLHLTQAIARRILVATGLDPAAASASALVSATSA